MNRFSLSIIFVLLIFIIALSSIIINNTCTIENNQTFAKIMVGVSSVFSAIIIWYTKNKFKNPNRVQPVTTQPQKPIIIQYESSKVDAQPQPQPESVTKQSTLDNKQPVIDDQQQKIINNVAENFTQNILDTVTKNINNKEEESNQKIITDIPNKIKNIYNNCEKLLVILKNIQNTINTLKLDKSINSNSVENRIKYPILTINKYILEDLIKTKLPSFNINIKLWDLNSNTVRNQLSKDLNKNNLNDIYKKLDEIDKYFEDLIVKNEKDLINELKDVKDVKDVNNQNKTITQQISDYSYYIRDTYYNITNTQGVLK